MSLYGLLLRLYPVSFRHEYGGEMRAVFERRRRDTPAVGRPALWASTVAETVTNAAIVHADILRQDLAYSLRVVQRSPGFSVVAVLVVALGIAATTAAFSVTDFVLIRPLPFPQADRLVKLWETTPGYRGMELALPNYRDWKAAATSFESVGVYHSNAMTLVGRGEPRRMSGASVSADLFPTLGVAPLLGRSFSEGDDGDGAPATMILSYATWRREFGGDPGVIGRSVTAQIDFDASAYTVIGVMPPTFHFPRADVAFWGTDRFAAGMYEDAERTNNWLYAVGRLRAGVTREQAQAEADVIAGRLQAEHPRENKDTGAYVSSLSEEVGVRSRLLLVALSGAAACLLLIACANLANLTIARAIARRHELAVRTALGAGRERLVRQLVTESLVLAGVGGAIGILLATLSVPLFAELVPSSLPIAAAPAVDLRVLLIAVAVTLLTGIAFGVAPVARVGREGHLAGLREGARVGGGRRERLRGALVVAEIGASVVLLVSTGLLIRALLAVQAVDPGFDREGVLTLRAELPMPPYERVATRQAYYARVLDEIRALPGVTAAGFVSFLPMSGFRGGIWPVSVEGDAAAGDDTRSAGNVAGLRYVTPGYFAALGVPLKRGRDVEDSDTQGRPKVAVVSESFVRRFWPGADPIGRRFTIAFAEREVVGVVGDVLFRGLERASEPQVYLAAPQVEDASIVFYVPKELAIRTAVPPSTMVPAVRDIIRRAEPRLAITGVRTLGELVDQDTASRGLQVRVLAGFALAALVLAAIGIHALLSFAVSQRTQEIGVRMALGARPADVLALVTGRSAMLAIVGLVPGVVIAYLAGRSMEALLFGVRPFDPVAYAVAVALTAVMTLSGTLIPALRALRVDPMTALRAE
jgi:putative ABC transport system permease protein